MDNRPCFVSNGARIVYHPTFITLMVRLSGPGISKMSRCLPHALAKRGMLLKRLRFRLMSPWHLAETHILSPTFTVSCYNLAASDRRLDWNLGAICLGISSFSSHTSCGRS